MSVGSVKHVFINKERFDIGESVMCADMPSNSVFVLSEIWTPDEEFFYEWGVEWFDSMTRCFLKGEGMCRLVHPSYLRKIEG